MPVATFDKPIDNIRVSQLDIKKGEFPGDWVKGGPIQDFSSIGIDDRASKISLTVIDDTVIVDTVKTKTLLGDIDFTGNVNFKKNVFVAGKLEVDELITKQLMADEHTERQYVEFSHKNKRKTSVGTGFIWTHPKQYTKQFVYLNKPDRFYSTEPLELHKDKSYMIGQQDVLSQSTLGASVVKSSLQQVGQLKNLKVSGRVEIGEYIFYDPNLDRIGFGTDKPAGDLAILNFEYDTNFVIDADEGLIKLGAYNNKSVGLITDDQVRFTIDPKGNLTVGQEGNNDAVHHIYGKVGIGIKNPQHSMDVVGNIKFQNRVFTVADRPPLKGRWNKGDTVWNKNPKEDAPVGWICTVGGNPGQWNSFGFIGKPNN